MFFALGTGLLRPVAARSRGIAALAPYSSFLRLGLPRALLSSPFQGLRALSVKRREGGVWTSGDSIPRKGLIGEGATDDFYTNKLDFAEASKLLKDNDLFHRAAEKDVEALTEEDVKALREKLRAVKRRRGLDVPDSKELKQLSNQQLYLEASYYALSEFVERGEILDREEITSVMHKVLNLGKGNFGILLGGVSTGKSFVLKRMIEERRALGKEFDCALRVDGRITGTDLTRGMWRALQALPANRQQSVLERAKKFMKGAATTLVEKATGSREGTPIMVEAADLIDAFVEEYADAKQAPCIIIDEANAVFEAKTPEEKERTIAVLRRLIQLSKQDKKLNVLLASSEHSEPYRLGDLGFKDSFFTDTIIADEVPPQAMLGKLRELGFRDNLAGALVAVYGGHVWTLVQAASTMTISSRFSPLRPLSKRVAADIVACLEIAETNEKRDGSMGGMRELLQQLATEGFAPLVEPTDPRARLLSEKNIAGTVTEGSVTMGVSADAWGDNEVGLIPSTQSTRLIIAKLLNQLPSKK